MVFKYLPPKAAETYRSLKEEVKFGEEPIDYLDHPEREIISWKEEKDGGYEGALAATQAAVRDLSKNAKHGEEKRLHRRFCQGEHDVKTGLRDGRCVMIHSMNGWLKLGFYKQGLQHGDQLCIRNTGTLEEINFKNGRPQGYMIKTFADGT